MKKNKKEVPFDPLVSFCVATYKRPEFLKATLTSLLNQTYKNFEIIVSDNDPEGSSEKIVKSLKSKKIMYHKNKKNIGVVKNFNQAFLLSKGEFITYLSDDDPIEPDMLETLVDLYKKYPDYDSFYGACSLLTTQENIAQTYQLKIGETPMKNITKKNNALTLLNPDNFLKKFFHYDVLPYFWWSTGITKRKVITNIGMMPEYGSLFFTDFCFICLIGTHSKMLVVNKVLGSQTIHSANSLRFKKDLEHLYIGINGYYKTIAPFAKKNNSIKDFQIFIANWVINHLLSLRDLSNEADSRETERMIKAFFKNLSKKYIFINNKKYEFYLKLFMPVPFNFIFAAFRSINLKTCKKLYLYAKIHYEK